MQQSFLWHENVFIISALDFCHSFVKILLFEFSHLNIWLPSCKPFLKHSISLYEFMSNLYFPLHCRYVYFSKLHFIICLFFQFCLNSSEIILQLCLLSTAQNNGIPSANCPVSIQLIIIFTLLQHCLGQISKFIQTFPGPGCLGITLAISLLPYCR